MAREDGLTWRILFLWVVNRNPTYLISACLMAVGSRLLLVGPSDATGDVKLILVTLAVLQLYEWSVAGILLVLHRARRSPEDQPSLLLVASLFWTGPMAATIEMTVLRPSLGTCLAVGACIIAISEMRFVNKTMGFRLSAAGQLIACACVVLITTVAPLLKIPESNSGLNEIYLYAAWWVFAGLVIGCLPALRSHLSSTEDSSLSSRKPEAWFLSMTIAATCTHLVGMNYGFFCHASLFYASPLIVAVSIVAFGLLLPAIKAYKFVLAMAAMLPGVAILFSLQSFSEDVPLARMPTWLRDPTIAVSAIVGIAWWYGYQRQQKRILLHAGCAAFALSLLRSIQGPVVQSADVDLLNVPILMYGSAAYLIIMACLFEARLEALLATAVQFVATTLMIKFQLPAAGLIFCIAAGWSAWIAIHLMFRRPWMLARFAPIVFLAVVPWTLEAATIYRTQIAIHSAILVFILFVAGQIWRRAGYRLVAGLVAVGHGVAIGADWTTQRARPEATALVLAGFAVLAVGALISWHKRHLLSLMVKKEEYMEPEPPVV